MTTTAILKPVKPCLRCGAIDRYINGNCKPCVRAATKKRRALNPEAYKLRNDAWLAKNSQRIKIYAAERRIAHPEIFKASAAAWYAVNSDRLKANSAAWRVANPERVHAAQAAYRLKNSAKTKAATAKWRAENPEAVLFFTQTRRFKLADGGKLSRGLSARLFASQKGLCVCCKRPLGKNYQLDHIVPLALGGTNVDANIQLLLPLCNQQKNAKHPIDFMQSRGFLL